jgi:predicted ferric reductase
MSRLARGFIWLGLYVLLVVLPMLVSLLAPGEGSDRPPAARLGVACGYCALTLLLLEFALISKIHAVSGVFGQDALHRIHRRMGILAAALVAMHAALGGGFPVEWLSPVGAEIPPAMRWGSSAGWVLVLLVMLSVFRKRLRLAYDWWQWSHGLLAEIAVVAAFVHLLLFGGTSAGTPMRALLAGYGLLFLGCRIWFQWVKPLQMWSKPWVVVSNRKELGDSRTLTLRPLGHDGFVFEPGQFAWICTGKTPFHKDKHPISMSSAAYDEPGREVSFTIKNLGDWSGGTVPALKTGDRVWLDGPYGVFTADREQGPGYVLIGGGAGIAPLHSICQTFAERGDMRPVYLFFGGRDLSRMIFREAFEELVFRINLHMVLVPEEPPGDWRGEHGYITAGMLRKLLPRQYKRFQYFICGPEAMVESMERILPALGVPAERIQTERFVIV